MKPERIEELRTLAARWMQPEEGTISCAIKAREAVLVSLEPAELLHLLRCARAVAERTCVWTRDADEQYGHDSWDGTCGVKWCIPVGTPSENGMNYCPRCGAKLEQAKETT